MLERTRQVHSLIDRQRSHAADALDDVIAAVLDAAHRLDEGGQSTLARTALSMARGADRISHYVRERRLEDIVDDTSALARRHPAAFIGTAFAAGLLLGRFARSSGGHSHLEA